MRHGRVVGTKVTSAVVEMEAVCDLVVCLEQSLATYSFFTVPCKRSVCLLGVSLT